MGVHDRRRGWGGLCAISHLNPARCDRLFVAAWICAEMAIAAPHLIDRMVLVGPMGIKPESGEIFDYFLESGMTGLRRAFHQPDQSSEFEPLLRS